MSYFSFGLPQGQELIVICLLVLLRFGAKRIPEFARGLGKSMGEFKKARKEFEDEIQRAADDVEIESATSGPAKSEARES